MPKIQWERLPREKCAHLRERAKEQQISDRYPGTFLMTGQAARDKRL
jgi:hypothetical protein